MYKTSKIFPWLSIRTKLIIAFAGLSLLPIIVIGVYGIITNTRMMRKIAVQNLNRDLSAIQGNTVNLMIGIESDLRLIRNQYLSNKYLYERDMDNSASFSRRINELDRGLLSIVRTRGIYYQIKVTDNSGNIISCVRSESSSSRGNTYRAVEADDLPKFPEVFYLYLIKDLDNGQIAIAPAEVLGSNDNIIPVVSFVMPVSYNGSRAGILIADVYVKNLFSTLQTYKPLSSDEEVILASGDGHYLYHSLKKKNWNKLLAGRNEYNLHHDFTPVVANEILSHRKAVISSGSSSIISHSPLFYGIPSIFNSSIERSFAIPLYLIVAVPKAVIMSPVHSYENTFAGVLLLFLVVSILLSLLATRHFTISLATLTKGAETITRGNYNYKVNVETGDEIEVLAEQFNLMARSLDEHEKEIQLYKTHLEEMVNSRTEELFAEKSKLQAILDNVPSAFLLLDKELRIQTASAAFNVITGYNIEDVKGENCSKIFGTNGFCEECVCMDAISKSKIEICTSKKIDDKQQERYIEHVAIPMKTNGEVIAVLAVITDITRRKRLENVLVKTEKLAATGEIAAFVAHEFRNSLTSIKMILQLLAESNHLAKSEKKSVKVALNSAGEMEETVAKLLNYAYPVPMNFRLTSIEYVLNESLDFVQLRFNKSRISLKKEIEPGIPSILMDASRLKEAVINVLLNAVQSIEEKRSSVENAGSGFEERNQISISVKKIMLKKTLHDYRLDEAAGYTQVEITERSKYEITLSKGSECIYLQITDTGTGIESKNITKIFDPFFTTKTNGTGLGLPMVKRTINAHWGIVTVESKTGSGTSFNIYIPLLNESYSLPEHLI